MAIEIDNKKMWETAIRLYRQITGHSEAFDKALEDMGLCYKDGEITTIEPKVEWYMCIKESAGFKAGHIYKCNGGRFVNDLGVMFTAGYWGDYFRPATEEEVMKYSYKDKPNYPLMPSECTTIEPEVKWYVALNDYGHYDNTIFDTVPLFLKGERTTKENVFNMCKDIMGYEITEEEFNKNFRPATEEEIPHDPTSQAPYRDNYDEIKQYESEDEMIRKDLLYWLYSYKDGNETFVPAGDVDVWITYLEKQGEQKPADKTKPKFKIKYASSEYNVLEVKDIAGVTYYGIEDEPNHIDYVQAENCERVDGYSIKEDGSPYPTKPAVFSEKNPAWSEEDELYIRELEGLVKRVWAIAEHENDKDTIHKMSDLSFFLKTLKPQSRQEWSEEDESILKELVQFIPKHLTSYSYNQYYNWAVSHRPQKQWKPSDEQMLAINTAINVLGKGTLNGKQLVELQEQLKKL